MIAHVAGMPIEELLVPLILGASAFGVGVRALISHRRGQQEILGDDRGHRPAVETGERLR